MNKPVMNIAVVSSREYLRYLAVLLTSIYENHPDILVHCYVLHEEITAVDEQPITEYIHSRGHQITFIKMDPDYVKDFPTPAFWPRLIWYRTQLHLFLPKHLERVLVLGLDIIVNKNIWDFYTSDFEGNYLIGTATQDLMIKERHKPGKGDFPFFNGDILIWNLGMFRENISISDCLEAIRESDGWVSHDERLLNYMFWDKVKLVDSSQYNYSYLKQARFNNFPTLASESETPYILHYFFLDKPWYMMMTENEAKRAAKFTICFTEDSPPIFTKYSVKPNAIWWKYAKMTPFHDDMYREMECAKRFMLSALPFIDRLHTRALSNSVYGALYKRLLDATNLSSLLAGYCSSHHIKSVAIYGYGDLGKLIYKNLTAEGSPVSVSYVIDRNPIDDPGIRRVESGLERYDPVDLVIVTALKDYEIIRKNLAGCLDCPIRSMLEIADELAEKKQ